jgi:hypothetical protein
MTDRQASDHTRRGESGDDASRADAAERSGVPVDSVSTGAPVSVPPTPGPAATNDSPKKRESRYPSAPTQPGQPPLTVRIELRLVDGPEGKKLRARQAAAIREALEWFAAHRDQETSAGSQDPPESSR